MLTESYDALIIGSGQGGTPLAKKLAGKGWKVAIIEKKHAGGTCVNTGCTPTKAMIASAKTIHMIRNAGKLGVDVSDYQIQIEKILDRKDEIVESFRSGSEEGLQNTQHLTYLHGTASFRSEKVILVQLQDGNEKLLQGKHIFIDAGTRPSIPEVSGIENSGYLTAETLMELREIPEHLVIIGGGYIGLEFGQMYRRFGSRVTILENSETFLSREDRDVAEAIQHFLQEEEVTIITGSKINNITKDQKTTVSITTADGSQKIICSHLLVAAGRTPNSDLLNLKAAGVRTDDHGYIEVDDQLKTSVEGIYALGDIKGGPAFTHISYNDYIVLFENLTNWGNQQISERMVPYTMFTDPQLGRVGMTEQEAGKQGKDILVARLPMTHVARAIETGDTRGMMKAVVDKHSKKILGVAILGQEGGEVMTVVQMAMAGELPWTTLKDMIIAHPLYAESLNNLFMKLETA